MTEEIKQEPSVLDLADEKIKKLEELTKKLDEQNKRQEDLISKQMLAGRGSFNPPEPRKDPQQELIDDLNRRLKPTGFKI